MDTRTQHTISAEPSSPPQILHYQQPPVVEEFPALAPGLVMSTLRSSQVWSGMAWRRAFPGRGDQSAPARRMVGQLLADTGRVDDARWVTAELVSNAVRHSRSGQERGFFVVEVLLGAETARIVVYDLGGGEVPDFSRTPGSVPEAAEHGRGLAGVRELAIRTGVAGDAITGHAVWADLALTSDASRTPPSVDEVRRSAAAGACEVAWRVPEAVSVRGLEPVPAGLSEPMIIGEVTRPDRALVGQEEVAGDAPGSRPGGLQDGVMVSVRGPGPVGEEGAGLAPFRGLVGGELRQEADRVSAFGQERWAQQALAGLRREWPDWAFLVVSYQWLAIRGKQAVISATGPQELRHALPCIPPKPNSTGPLPASGSAVPGPIERGVSLPTLAVLLETEPGVSWTRASASPPSASALTPGTGAGGARGGDGVGAGLSGLTAVAPSPGVMADERSVTGAAVAGADGARVAWWPNGWLWGRRRDRSLP